METEIVNVATNISPLLVTGLSLITIAVLLGPLFIKKVEHNIEAFLFVMGLIASTISGMWSFHLIKEALVEPINITVTVLIVGILFRLIKAHLQNWINSLIKTISLPVFIFLLVVILGLFSSVITAIIAAIVLVEIISILRLERKTEINLVIVSCFAIGMGAALTPVGEPLSTIAVAKLKGEPYHANFFFLFKILFWYLLPGIVALGIFATTFKERLVSETESLKTEETESWKDIFIRALRVYIFVMALIFLGTGFKPMIDAYISKVSSNLLFWINMVSAILDNATLTAAEIGPIMTLKQIQSALLGLLIAGGMLIPGNIPNIISANKLKISSREWAKLGIPLGFILMLVYFIVLQFIK